MGEQWKQWETSFWVSKITSNGACSHEIKDTCSLEESYDQPRHLIKKQRHYFADTSPSSQSYSFPVVMNGCENWTVKKAEHWRIDTFELWCWRRFLRFPWSTSRSNQSILKEISPQYSLEGLMLKLKLQYFAENWLTWKDTDAGKDWRQKEMGTTEDEMVVWHHQHNGYEFE